MSKKVTLFLVIVVLSFSWVQAEDVVLLQNTEIDAAALNFESSLVNFNTNINGRTYQQYPQATYNGYQYVTYYDSDRYVCVGRRSLPDGAWEVIRLTDYTINGNDSHNVTAIGICTADGTIHLAFDHHADTLNYRVSVQGVVTNPESVVWDASLFGPVTDKLGSIGPITFLTYPRFIPAPNGNLFLYYRYGGSGSGDGMIQEYDGTAHTWTPGLGKFISRQGTYDGPVTPNSTSRNPYINGISFAGSRLHASWGWRETSTTSQSNHDICYAYSDDYGRTWCNNEGTVIGTMGSTFIDVDSPGLVVAAIEQGISLSNQYTHYVYPNGSVHVMVVHKNAAGDVRYHHYWRNPAGTWSGKALSFSGSRPKLAGTDDGTLFLVYSTGGHIRIAKGIPNADMTDWSWSSVYTQSETSGGEGHFDLMRWNTDGILSVYDQQRPSSDGAPSSLRMYDYDVGYIIPEPPVAKLHYPLDGDLIEAEGSGLDGILVSGGFAPSLVQHDQGLLLDGVNDYVEIPGYKGVTGKTSRTCAAWIKTTTAPGEIISWGSSDPGAKWIMRVNDTGSLRAEVEGGYIYGTTPINDGLWHHVAVVLDSDGTPDISEALLYVDGQLEPIAGVLDELIDTAKAQNVTIGVYTTLAFRYFQGQIDDVRIYSSALTESEIAEMAHITPPSPDIVPDYVIDLADLSALSAYWLDGDCFSNNLCDGRDLNADQMVDFMDFSILSQLWLSPFDPPLAMTVEDFQAYAVDTRMNGLTSTGPLGGLWDIHLEDENNESKDGVVQADTNDPNNHVIKIDNGYNSYRSLSVSQLSDPIEEGEAGILFFRFMYAENGLNGALEFEAGIHAFAADDDDPLTPDNGNDLSNIIAGFGATDTSASTFDITTIDGSGVLMTGLDRYRWYNVWIIADNGTDTYDLYILPADSSPGPAGPLTGTPIAADVPFNSPTTEALSGGLWLVGKSEVSRGATVRVDDIAWSGNF